MEKKEDNLEKKIKHKILSDKVRKLLNEGKEEELEKTKEVQDIIFKIKHGAQKKVPNYKNGTLRTIYL